MASGYGPEWDQVLRGLVYEAASAKGTDEYESALHQIVDAYYAWPLAEALMYLDDARDLLMHDAAEREQEQLDWYEAVFTSAQRSTTCATAVAPLAVLTRGGREGLIGPFDDRQATA